MAAPRNAATTDRHARVLLGALVFAALVMFLWVVVGLFTAAFG